MIEKIMRKKDHVAINCDDNNKKSYNARKSRRREEI